MHADLAGLVKKAKGVTDDSRKVEKGFLFVAVKGLSADGHDFIPEAIKRGATAVVGEKSESSLKSVLSGATYVQTKDSREALGYLASEFYGSPSTKLKIIGVTGTDGKTTTASLIYHILKFNGKKAGLISTVSAKLGDAEYDTGFHVTNPDPVMLNKFLAEMVKKNFDYAVLEVTSHGIDQKRIAGINFDICAVTNITHEHLDYHKTFENYRNTKLSFLKLAKEKVILNKDDSSYTFLCKNLDGSKIISYERTKDIKGILPGVYNESNLSAAIAVCSELGISREKSLGSIDSFEFPIGRLEEIKNDLGIKIYVDFAHTPNALKNVLTLLKGKTKGKLVAVFGCASERDPGKRPAMARISSELADISVFTVEDSRSENIYNIFKPMAAAARRKGKILGKDFFEIPERGEAIAFAITKAKKGDSVVICGKGHEKSLAYYGYEHPWRDQDAVHDFLNSKKDISVVVLAAGKGTRMKSREPKVLRMICGRPMAAYTLQNLRKSGMADITLVVGFRRNLVLKRLGGAVKFAIQKNPKGGTADAAKAGFKMVSPTSKTLVVINGDDSAFYTPETIQKIISIHLERERKLTFVSLMKQDPTGLGRVVRGENGLITKIVEEKDTTPEEKLIKEVNDGLYVFDRKWFAENIDKVKKGQQGEYYLVDLVKMAIDQGARMATYTLPNDDEWQGVNTPEQLEEANRKMALRLVNQ